MNELILGIAYFGHDSSVSLIDSTNNNILYCLTEERFSNKKHDSGLPVGCLDIIDSKIKELSLGQISYVATNSDHTILIREYLPNLISQKTSSQVATRIHSAVLETFPFVVYYEPDKYPATYLRAILRDSGVAIEIADQLIASIGWYVNWALKIMAFQRYIQKRYPGATLYPIRHHLCHMASVFFTSKFTDSAILILDGQGEAETITMGYAKGNQYKRISHSIWPHSIGSFYMDMTAFLGFRGNTNYPGFGEEYKVMGMAGYGAPTHIDFFRERALITDTGEFRFLEDAYLQIVAVPGCPGHFKMAFTPAFESALGGRREPSDPIEQQHFNIAASLQQFIEEIGVTLASFLKEKIPETANICLGGGIALNGLMNMSILRKAGFKNIFIFPASGDDGTSLGAAAYVHAISLGRPVFSSERDVFKGVIYTKEEVEHCINLYDLKYKYKENISKVIAQKISENYIVARYIGAAEYGPRALGHRSVLANPRHPKMKEILNTRIKHREPFRPFAPACLNEETSRYFDIDCDAPYMLLICNVLQEKRNEIPSVVHEDGTARLQTVQYDANPDFYAIISEFYAITGTPILINTSFNVNGEAIVENPLDAIEAFLFMDIDYLAIDDFLIAKSDNADKAIGGCISNFLKRRQDRYHARHQGHEMFLNPTEFPGSGAVAMSQHLMQVYKEAAEERLVLINRLDDECRRLRAQIEKK